MLNYVLIANIKNNSFKTYFWPEKTMSGHAPRPNITKKQTKSAIQINPKNLKIATQRIN